MVDVQITTDRPDSWRYPEELPKELKQLPVIYSIPVELPSAWLSATSQVVFNIPIKEGTLGSLMVSDYGLENWNGSDGEELVKTREGYYHDFNSGKFVPGLSPNARQYDPSDNFGMIFKDKKSEIESQIVINQNGDIEVSGNSSVKVNAGGSFSTNSGGSTSISSDTTASLESNLGTTLDCSIPAGVKLGKLAVSPAVLGQGLSLYLSKAVNILGVPIFPVPLAPVTELSAKVLVE